MQDRWQNIPEFTVSQISVSIKSLIEDSFGYVKIRGEVSGFKKASSGHLYFSLKDENSLIYAVCFKTSASKISFQIEDGLELSVFGKVTTYIGRSNYQIIVEKVEISGIGALMELVEKRRLKLLKEGLFDKKYKKSLPFWPSKIGVITSKTGAVIEDIIHRVEDRFPTNILLYPAVVQGQNAVFEIIKALKYFNSMTENIPDVIIIARGGGSVEDLMAFNDESLVREVFLSKIAVVSAIGHETDTTLIDYVSDVRAPTPSAAAEIVTPLLSNFKEIVKNLDNLLTKYFYNYLNNKEKDLLNLSRNLTHPKNLLNLSSQNVVNIFKKINFLFKNNIENKEQKIIYLSNSIKEPDNLIQNQKNKLKYLSSNLNSIFREKINGLEGKINLSSKLLDSYHYKKVLKRGYAIIRDNNGDIADSATNLSINESLNIEMHDAKIDTIIKSINKNEDT